MALAEMELEDDSEPAAADLDEQVRDALGPVSGAGPETKQHEEPDSAIGEVSRPPVHDEPAASSQAVGEAQQRSLADFDEAEVHAAFAGILEARALRGGVPLDPEVWGPDPEEEEVIAASATSHTVLTEAREHLRAESLDVEEFAARAGLEPADVRERLRRGQLVSITVHGELHVPAWQLVDEGLLPGLDRVLPEISGGGLTISGWMRSPSRRLNGRTPRRALLDGDIDEVVVAARARES